MAALGHTSYVLDAGGGNAATGAFEDGAFGGAYTGVASDSVLADGAVTEPSSNRFMATSMLPSAFCWSDHKMEHT